MSIVKYEKEIMSHAGVRFFGELLLVLALSCLIASDTDSKLLKARALPCLGLPRSPPHRRRIPTLLP